MFTPLRAVFAPQAWAVASGKINEFPNDKARWKTNFRCALNNLSERFKMIKDNSKNSDDPHKIYEIINTARKLPLKARFWCKCIWTLNTKSRRSFFFPCRKPRRCRSTGLPGGLRHDSRYLHLFHRVHPLRKWGSASLSLLSVGVISHVFVFLSKY